MWGVAPPPQPGQPPARPPIARLKWTPEDFAAAPEGGLPMGKAMEEWAYGDLDAGFASAALVLDETFVVNSTGHHPMETRSAMAYWQNDKCFLHCSTQSVVRTVDGVARWVGIDPSKLVLDFRVHRRRLRQQGRRRRVDGHSVRALEEGRRAGDDAREPRGRELLRPGPHEHDRTRQGGLRHGRPHHRARSLHRAGRRPLRPDGRSSLRRPGRVARLPGRRSCAGAR